MDENASHFLSQCGVGQCCLVGLKTRTTSNLDNHTNSAEYEFVTFDPLYSIAFMKRPIPYDFCDVKESLTEGSTTNFILAHYLCAEFV